jgi:hypothetical protein
MRTRAGCRRAKYDVTCRVEATPDGDVYTFEVEG